jgi:hypothetical protein
MTDGSGLSPTLADLVTVAAEAELLDWDLSALVDWPSMLPRAQRVSVPDPKPAMRT